MGQRSKHQIDISVRHPANFTISTTAHKPKSNRKPPKSNDTSETTKESDTLTVRATVGNGSGDHEGFTTCRQIVRRSDFATPDDRRVLFNVRLGPRGSISRISTRKSRGCARKSLATRNCQKGGASCACAGGPRLAPRPPPPMCGGFAPSV